MRVPVVLIIFNRPDTTEKVFSEIAKAKPPKLLVVADGPRPNHPDDVEKCAAARAIIERVNWDCEVIKNYSEVNLGCAYRPATGIDWAFEHVEEAIILEDDCVPHPTFFRFCEEMLERYRDDERIMMVSGRNHLGQRQTPYSYFFGYIMMSIWGWATWRRAWRHYDLKIQQWPMLRETPWLIDILGNPRAVNRWEKIFDRAYDDVANVNTWDHQWSFSCWTQNGLAITPRVNLVYNIGFDENATHTKSMADKRIGVPVIEMTFPLRHPPFVIRDAEADELCFTQIIQNKRKRPNFARRFYRKSLAAVRRLLHKQVDKNNSV